LETVLEALVKCGAFESMGYTRAELNESVPRLVDFMKRASEDRNSGQVGLFGGGGGASPAAAKLNIPQRPEWPERLRLSMEKEALGLYITGHPMDAYLAEADTFATHNTLDLLEQKREAEVHIAGIAASAKIIVTKAKQQKMAFVQFEDRFGSVELTVFPRTFEKVEELLGNTDQPLLVKARIDEVDRAEGIVKLIAVEIRSLAEVRETETTQVTFCFDAADATDASMQKLTAVLRKHGGAARTRVQVKTAQGSVVEIALPEAHDVRPSPEMMEATEIAFGKRIATFD